MTIAYTVSSLVRMTLSVTTDAGTPVTPTLTLKVQAPDETVTDITGTIVTDSVGNFHADYQPETVGLFQYEWIGTGAATVAVVGNFLVNQGLF